MHRGPVSCQTATGTPWQGSDRYINRLQPLTLIYHKRSGAPDVEV